MRLRKVLHEAQNPNDFFNKPLKIFNACLNELEIEGQDDPNNITGEIQFLKHLIKTINLTQQTIVNSLEQLQKPRQNHPKFPQRKIDEIAIWLCKWQRFLILAHLLQFQTGQEILEKKPVFKQRTEQLLSTYSTELGGDPNSIANLYQQNKTWFGELGVLVLLNSHLQDMLYIAPEVRNIVWNIRTSPEQLTEQLAQAETVWQENARLRAGAKPINYDGYRKLTDYINLDNRTFIWLASETNYSKEEAEIMGHCATGRHGSHLWSLREILSWSPSNEPTSQRAWATVEYLPNQQLIGEWKGQKNSKIAEQNPELLPLMMPILMLPEVKGFTVGSYRSSADFRPTHLPRPLARRIWETRPQLMGVKGYVEVFGDENLELVMEQYPEALPKNWNQFVEDYRTLPYRESVLRVMYKKKPSSIGINGFVMLYPKDNEGLLKFIDSYPEVLPKDYTDLVIKVNSDVTNVVLKAMYEYAPRTVGIKGFLRLHEDDPDRVNLLQDYILTNSDDVLPTSYKEWYNLYENIKGNRTILELMYQENPPSIGIKGFMELFNDKKGMIQFAKKYPEVIPNDWLFYRDNYGNKPYSKIVVGLMYNKNPPSIGVRGFFSLFEKQLVTKPELFEKYIRRWPDVIPDSYDKLSNEYRLGPPFFKMILQLMWDRNPNGLGIIGFVELFGADKLYSYYLRNPDFVPEFHNVLNLPEKAIIPTLQYYWADRDKPLKQRMEFPNAELPEFKAEHYYNLFGLEGLYDALTTGRLQLPETMEEIVKNNEISSEAAGLLVGQLSETEEGFNTILDELDLSIDTKGNVILEKFNDVEDMVSDIVKSSDNNYPQSNSIGWAMKIVIGDADIDTWYHGTIDWSYMADDLIKTSEELTKIITYIKDKHGQELEDDHDYDMNAQEVINCLRELDSEVYTTMQHAYSDGLNAGTQNEIWKAFNSAVIDNDMMYYDQGLYVAFGENTEPREIEIGRPCYIYMQKNRFQLLMRNKYISDIYNEFTDGNWKSSVDKPFSIDKDRDFSDLDEEAMHNSFWENFDLDLM